MLFPRRRPARPWILIALSVVLLQSGCANQLVKAAQRGDMQTVQALVAQGADVNGVDYGDGMDITNITTALHEASARGDIPMMTFLLQRGASVHARDRWQHRPLHYAIDSGNAEAVKLLLDSGADVNAASYGGKSVLHEAAIIGKPEIVKLLLERGADPSRRAEDGTTPADRARARGHQAALALLQPPPPPPVVMAQPPPPAMPPTAAPPPTLPPSAVLTSDVDVPAATAPAQSNRYAIVVGIEHYRGKLPKADFADHDAKVMRDYLAKSMGFAEENIALLLNEQATKTDFEKYIEHWLPNRVEPGSTVFVYYSGHGAPNPKTGDAFLVPYDGDPTFVDATGYPLKRLYAQLNKLPAKEVVVLLDSCFSGSGGRSVIAKGMRPIVLSVENPILAGGKAVVLAASKGDQVSSAYDPKNHGLLTYFFLKGLRGEADTNKDGTIELAEIFNYVRPQVERTARREYNNDQTPQLIGSPEVLNRGVVLTGAKPVGSGK